MTQEEIILTAIERLGGRITTFELMDLHVSQYQARLKSLREKLALKGWILTEGERIRLNGRRNYMYRLIKPEIKQPILFESNQYTDYSIKKGEMK